MPEMQITILEQRPGEKVMPPHKDSPKYQDWKNKISRYGKGSEIVFHENENGCHICISHCLNGSGYPMITHLKKHMSIAHLMYERKFGELPACLLLRHTCDNRECINPNHLITGTKKDNTRDMLERNRASRLYGETNHNSKLNDKQVIDILTDLKNGMKPKEVACKFGVSRRTISGIKTGTQWGWLTGIKPGCVQ